VAGRDKSELRAYLPARPPRTQSRTA